LQKKISLVVHITAFFQWVVKMHALRCVTRTYQCWLDVFTAAHAILMGSAVFCVIWDNKEGV